MCSACKLSSRKQVKSRDYRFIATLNCILVNLTHDLTRTKYQRLKEMTNLTFDKIAFSNRHLKRENPVYVC